MQRRNFCLSTLAWAGGATAALAQDRYPQRPITLVVPFAPGGNIDLTARTIADRLGQRLGQTVIVDNRPGAGGVIGAAAVARAKPDGYTLLLGNSGTNAVANAISKKVPYDGVDSFTLIGGITTNPAVLTVGLHVPATDFAQFKRYADSRNGGVSMGTAGNGSFTHLVVELLRSQAQLPLTVVPYKGTGPAATDLMSRQLDGMVDQITTAAPLVREKRVRAIAQLGSKRSPLLPDVPTLAEQGFQDIDGTLYTGLFGPAGLSKATTETLAQALQAVLAEAPVQKRYRDMGAEPWQGSGEAFARHAAQELRRWRETAQASQVSIDD